MKITLFAFLVIASLTETIVLADGNTGIVRGVALLYDSDKPIAGAYVTWVNASGMGQTRTDGHGRFYFFDVTPGITNVYLTQSGFNTSCTRGSIHANETVDVTVTMNRMRGMFPCSRLHIAGHEAVEDAH